MQDDYTEIHLVPESYRMGLVATTFADAVKQYRQERGMTQMDLAIAIRRRVPGSKISSNTVSHWEIGDRLPNPAMRVILRQMGIEV